MSVDREARERVVAEYRASGLTQAEFAAARGMKLSALQAWIYRRVTPRNRASGRGDAGSARFVEVRAPEGAQVELQIGELVVRSAGFPPVDWVASLLARARA